MAGKTFVLIPQHVHAVISEWAEKAYPNEGCGLLIGTVAAASREVVRFVPLENKLLKRTFADAGGAENVREIEAARLSTLPEERKNRPEVGFAMDPSEFSRETLRAGREGLDVVGILHTHPDHPPRPSKIDESQPFLSQWSNVIVAVDKGRTREMRSWFRERDGEPFSEEEIRIQS